MKLYNKKNTKFMEETIAEILIIISDYRKDDIGKTINNEIYETVIDEQHVKRWIEQFDVNDREFILKELLHILKKTYLSKDKLINILKNGLSIISTKYNYANPLDFFEKASFFDNQAENKSQKEFLKIINDILQEEYNISINECGKKGIKHWLYFDDVLATGGNLNKDILFKVSEYDKDDFLQQNIKIYGIFIAIHSLAKANIPYSLNFTFNGIMDKISFVSALEIENDPRIIKYHNPSPKFNLIYPLKSNTGEKALEFIGNTFFRDKKSKHEEYAFRNDQFPIEEDFFSSKENRIKFENIILDKSFYIMQGINNIKIPGLRPLGCTSPNYKTLGTGTLFFTWRNISNTCPLVFWWGQNWYPLFPVKGRGK